jgi:diacylglycerol O-acyltransferase
VVSTGSRQRAAAKSAQRMKGFDFATWRTADDDPVMRSAIVGLLITETAPNWDELIERFDRASRVNIALRQRVIDQGGLTTPRLVIDPDFDLTFHMRRFRMPVGSTWADVLEDARRQSMTDFDKDRPLWRVTLLEDLPDGRSAIILKLHHAIADGQGAVMLGASLFDFSPKGEDLGPLPEAPKADAQLNRLGFAEAIVRDKVEWASRSTQDFVTGFAPATLVALRNPGDTVNRITRTVGSLARFTRVPLGPLSPLMTERSINYHFGTFDLPFDQIRTAGKQSGHTANDVFLAAVGEGMGTYHRKLGKPVESLRVNMPVSTRVPGAVGGVIENAVNIARFEIPTIAEDAVTMMDQIAATVLKVRSEPALSFANELGELSRFIPSDIVAAAAQSSDVTASNVPGVPIPVWLAGAKVERMYPLVATIGAAVNVTMLTYNGIASVGVSTDDAAVSDPDILVESLRQGFANVVGHSVPATTPFGPAAAAKRSGPGTAKSTAAKKPAARKAPAKKAPAKKAPAKKAPVTRAPVTRAPAKKSPAKKAPAKKAPATKATS